MFSQSTAENRSFQTPVDSKTESFSNSFGFTCNLLCFLNLQAEILVALVALISIAASFPMQVPDLNPKFEVGKKFYVSSVAELREIVNSTVPEALTSGATPPEYFREQGVTSDSDILSNIVMTRNSRLRRKVRSVTPSCPVSWVVNFEANRQPARIQKAVCNGQGTTCLSNDGRPACEEIIFQYMVVRFYGLTSTGVQVWRYEKQDVPVACTCSAL